MPVTEIENLDHLRQFIGREIAVSDWLTMTQERVNQFAEATGDHQWIHVDPQRAVRESPYGAPIAHGYLTLSLMAKFMMESMRVKDMRMGVNYGVNKVRFTAPVKVGDRIRGHFTVHTVEDIPGGAQVTWSAWIELEGGDKPACVAELVSRRYS